MKARAIGFLALCGLVAVARTSRAELNAPPRLVLWLASADEPSVVVPGQEPAAPPAGRAVRPAFAPGPAPVDPDAGLGARQVGTGTLALFATTALGSGVIYLAAEAESPALAYTGVGIGVLIPAVVGMTVCHVGTGSKVYDGRCFPTVGGAYIGALGLLPGALVGTLLTCSNSSSSSADDSSGLEQCFVGAVVGGAVGFMVGTLVGSYAGWRIFKRPKPGVVHAVLF